MPFSLRLPGARLAGGRLLCLAGVGAVPAVLPPAARLLHAEGSPRRSDVILVLAGTLAERPLKAYDLYRSGYASTLVLRRELADGGQLALARAIPYPDRADLTRGLVARLGVPANAIAVLAGPHDTTVDEAKSFRDLVRSRGRHRVIIVTSKVRTRRVRLMIKRQ